MSRAEFLELEDDFRIYQVKKYNKLSDTPKAKLEFKIPKVHDPSQCRHIADKEQAWLIDRVGDVYRCWDVPGQEKYRVGTIDDLLCDGKIHFNDWIMNEEIREETGCYQCKMAPVCMVACPSEYFQNRTSGVYTDKHQVGNPFCSPWRFGIEHTLASQYRFFKEFPEMVFNFPPQQKEKTPELIQIDKI